MTEKERYFKEIERLKKENKNLKKQITNLYKQDFKDIKDYGEIYDKLNTFVFLTDKDTFEIIYANKKTKEKYGEVTGKKCWEVFENRTDGPCEFCDYAKNRENFGKEFNDLNREFFNKSENKWFLVHDVLVDLKNLGKKRLSIAYDIDKQKRLQDENTERVQNIRHIFNNVDEAIFVVQNNKFKFLNKSTEKFFGIKQEELLKMSVSDFILSPFKDRFFDTVSRVFENKLKQKVFYIKVRDGKNNIRDVKIKHETVRWKGEKSILVVLQDITEERKIKKKLRESEKFYKILFEYSPMPVVILRDEKIVLYNNAFKKYVKTSDLKYLNYTGFADLLHPDSVSKIEKAIEEIQKGVEFISIDDVKVFNFDGEILHISLVISSVVFRSEPSLIVIVNDVTEKIKAEEELRKTISVKDKFFSIIAHDLRNPFNQISGFADLLTEDMEFNDLNRVKRLIEYIKISSENGQKLLENLLSWAKTQTGSVVFNPENINLTEEISQIISFFKANADRKNIKLNFNKNKEVDCAFFDKEMFKTVMRNLLSNALKYTKRGGEVDVSVYEKRNEYQINVSDTGIGMTEEQKNKIFKLDEVFTLTGTENEKGSGLGLAVCKEFVKKNNGKIFVETEKGKGSTFSFTAKKCLE